MSTHHGVFANQITSYIIEGHFPAAAALMLPARVLTSLHAKDALSQQAAVSVLDMLCLACRQGKSHGLDGPKSVSESGGPTSSWPFQVRLSPRGCGATFSARFDGTVRTETGVAPMFRISPYPDRVISMFQISLGCCPPHPPAPRYFNSP